MFLIEKRKAFYKHTHNVEKTFICIPFARRQSGRSVAMEIPKPFAVFGVGKMIECVFYDLFEYFGVLFVARMFIEHQRRDNRFVMRPPEFYMRPCTLFQRRSKRSTSVSPNIPADCSIQPKNPPICRLSELRRVFIYKKDV